MSKHWQEENRAAYRAAWRKWYRANAARKVAWQARRREELRRWWNGVKAALSCEECGESAPECLHFHHVDTEAKELEISGAIVNGWSKQRILAEAAKCRVLCANCHAKHHWHERSY